LIAKYLTEASQNLTVVGDASQSIYRWRGADYRNLDYLRQDFPGLTTIKLEQNYRSTQVILDAAHSVIQNNRTHPILSLWTDKARGHPITIFQADDERHEAEYIIRQIKDAGLAADKTAILYRTNAQSRAFEEVCIRSGIPYVLVGGTKFYDRKEVKDILAYLRLLYNPKDTVSLTRLEKLGKRRLEQFLSRAGALKPKTTSTVKLFDQITSITGYLDRFDPKLEADLARIENIKELRSVATQFDSLGDFLENVSLVEKNTLSEVHGSQQPLLTLMTIHASKGLEFDTVYIAGLEEGIFPHSRSSLEPLELEEERRLCYVALTRAKTKLCLTYTQNRLYYGGRHHNVVSRFLSEIPEHLLRPAPYLSSRPSLDDDLLEKFLNDEIDVSQLMS
jgi:DNA helicase-2/ATP-dependent DNA helicase PcrA